MRWMIVVLIAFAGPAAQDGDGRRLFAGSPQYPMLPPALETELALSAAPKHVRNGASVWVLDTTGYKLARQGQNAFSCIVSRRAGDLFPVCWDAEGARTLMQLDFEDAQLRLAGRSGSEIDRIVSDRLEKGQDHAPSRAGIAYMLSPMRYRIDEHGVVARTPSNPHLMFYGPNLTDADIGGARGAFVFINRVGPEGMMIVPVGQKERDVIVAESESLVAQLEHALGYQAAR
jgi:hypothetical protein